MKKTTKALYAAAAGLALITSAGGGRATYASWIDSRSLGTPATTIQTGDLRLTFAPLPADRAPEWGKPCGPVGESATDSFQSVCWQMTVPPSTSHPQGQTFANWNWGSMPAVGPNYVVTGTTRIRTTLAGETLAANLRLQDFEFVNYGDQLLVDWLDKAKTSLQIQEVATEARPAVSLLPVKYFDFSDQKANSISNVDLHPGLIEPEKLFDVIITIRFPSDALPVSVQAKDENGNPMFNADGSPVYTQFAATRHLGDIHFQLLQQINDSTAFGRQPVTGG